MTTAPSFLNDVAQYYSTKLADHGETPRGVDWNSEESQVLRFTQLCKIIDDSAPFSLNDFGCGYGALLDYLRNRFADVIYRGCDVSVDMIQAATNRYRNEPNAQFAVSAEPLGVCDYGIASGIFNVRLGCSDAMWLAHIHASLDILSRTSTRGFAFNCLTSYSDADKLKHYLYYADPLQLFHFCKKRYSRNVALLHDYGLFEFTILVRK